MHVKFFFFHFQSVFSPSQVFSPIFFLPAVCVCMWGGGTALHFCPMKPVLRAAWGVMVHVCYEGGQDRRRQGFGPSRPILPEPAALLHFNTNTAAVDLPWHAGGLSVCSGEFLHTYVQICTVSINGELNLMISVYMCRMWKGLLFRPFRQFLFFWYSISIDVLIKRSWLLLTSADCWIRNTRCLLAAFKEMPHTELQVLSLLLCQTSSLAEAAIELCLL